VLVGSADELEGWRARFADGLMSALSVGFGRDRHRDAYERPRRKGGPPVVRPRGITIVEVSLVQWGAYDRAGVTSLSVRPAADQDRHEQSERTIAETVAFMSSLATRRK
jgi:phage head maturation protease